MAASVQAQSCGGSRGGLRPSVRIRLTAKIKQPAMQVALRCLDPMLNAPEEPNRDTRRILK